MLILFLELFSTVEEFFPYFRYGIECLKVFCYFLTLPSFLKVKHTGDIETFRQNYVTKKDSIGMERLHTMLRKMMIRRYVTCHCPRMND
jgi:hypothetical protein